MDHKSADNPESGEGRQYHLETLPGDIAERCLLVGSPERAELIATEFLKDARKVGDHRGLKSFTGTFWDKPVSVITTGMGSASMAIVLPEAVKSGARCFIRVGSCGALDEIMDIGDAVICTGAVRYDGASENWAPIEVPALATWHIVAALHESAERLKHPHHIGLGATTTCFNEGQGRPDPLRGDRVPERMRRRHEEMVRCGVRFYSMEEATLFIWCQAHGEIPCGAIDAVYANRVRGTFGTEGDRAAAEIALRAFWRIPVDGRR